MTMESWSLDASPAEREFRVHGVDELCVRATRLNEGPSAGVDVLTLQSGPLAVRVVPTRGMGVWDMHYENTRIGWESPVCGPIHPAYVPLGEASGLGWLDGFDELLVRCGLESNGAPVFDARGSLVYPLHGRIANKPARDVRIEIDGDAREIRVVGVVDEIRFHFAKLRMTSVFSMRAGEKGFRLVDQIENLSAKPIDMQLLYHVNFGAPLLEEGARIAMPVKTVVPGIAGSDRGVAAWDRFDGPKSDYAEQVFFCELLAAADGRTLVVLQDAAAQRGVRMGFNKSQLPWFTVWKNTVAKADGYVTGLEPGTNFPNARTHEAAQGRIVTLPPGGRRSFEFDLTYLSAPEEVAQAVAETARLQGTTAPNVFPAMQPGWCAM